MKILAIQGSARPDGNTQEVLSLVLEAAKEAGAHVETIQVSELEVVATCDECFECQDAADEPGCRVDDEMQPVIRKALEADMIVLATPVFDKGPAAHLQFAMDRFYCLFKSGDDGSYHSLLSGRKMAAVVTSSGSEDDGAADVCEVCQRVSDLSQTQWAGALMATELNGSASVTEDSDLRSRAQAFGRSLVN